MRTLLALLLLAPLTAHAEGARLTLDCTLMQRCDEGGNCQPGRARIHFTLTPQTIDTVGVGHYAVELDQNATLTAMGAGRLGPFVWQSGDQRLTLALSSATGAVLIRQDIASDAPPIIDLLSCEISL